MKDYEINELNIQVNDLRGKFIKPTLKKVSKYENKFAKLQKKAAEFNFRNQLKTVKKKEFELEDDKANAPPKPECAAGPPLASVRPRPCTRASSSPQLCCALFRTTLAPILCGTSRGYCCVNFLETFSLFYLMSSLRFATATLYLSYL